MFSIMKQDGVLVPCAPVKLWSSYNFRRLETIIDTCLETMNRGLIKVQGILIEGDSGTGKSQSCDWLASLNKYKNIIYIHPASIDFQTSIDKILAMKSDSPIIVYFDMFNHYNKLLTLLETRLFEGIFIFCTSKFEGDDNLRNRLLSVNFERCNKTELQEYIAFLNLHPNLDGIKDKLSVTYRDIHQCLIYTSNNMSQFTDMINKYQVEKIRESPQDRVYKKLMDATKECNMVKVLRLLERIATINNIRDDNPLHLTARLGLIDTLKLILNQGIKIRDGNYIYNTSLHLAAKYGHIDCVEELLDYGADANDENKNGDTALHLAAKYGHVDCVKELGINVCKQNKRGNSPLHLAAKNGHIDCIRILLEKGALIDMRNNSGYTALHFAAHNGHLDCVKELLKNKADIDVLTTEGDNAFNLAVYGGYLECMKELLVQGANIHLLDQHENTVLHMAAQNGHLMCMKEVMKLGIDIHTKNKYGNSPVYLAAQEGHSECMIELLNQGACSDGLLHITTSGKCVKELVNRGMNINERNESGRTPLHEASIRGNIEVILALLELHADIDTQDNDGKTALHFASNNSNIECVTALLKHGHSNPNIKDCEGNTALLVCSNMSCIRELLNYGSDVNVKNNDVETLIHKLVCNFDFCYSGDHFEELLKHNVDLNAQNSRGNTALHLLLNNYFPVEKCMTMLLEHGASPNIKNNYGNTPLNLATKYGHTNCVRILLNKE